MSLPEPVHRATVLGGGAFGTCLALVLARKGATVALWHPASKECASFNAQRENTLYLAGVRLPERVTYTADVAAAVQGAELLLFAIPTQFVASFLTTHHSAITAAIDRAVAFVVCCKGIEKGTLRFPADIFRAALGAECCAAKMAVLAGPSFAKEVAQGQLTGVTVAAATLPLARSVQRRMSTDDGTFRAYASTDIVGCEVASALKNVLAIASGVCAGLGLGRNARAFLITMGLAEISRLATALGSNGSSIVGLAGLGDLLLTCSSEQSRNFTVGKRLGEGETLKDVTHSMRAVAEGVATSFALADLRRKLGVRLPLCAAVHDVLCGTTHPKDAMAALVLPARTPLSDEPLPRRAAL